MIRHRLTIACTLLGVGFLAMEAQGAYIASDGQYLDWDAAVGGLTTTATPAIDQTRFTAKTNNALAPITLETVGGESAARIVDVGTTDNWQNVGSLTRSYGALASADFDYAVNLGFYIKFTGSTSTMLVMEEWASDKRSMALGAQKNGSGTGYRLFFNLGGVSGQSIGGNSQYFQFDTWYDVSMHRLTSTTYDVTVVDRATQQSWSQSIVNTSTYSSLLGQSMLIGSGTGSRQYTMDVAFDSLKIGEVPEPASLGLLGAASLLVLRRRRSVEA